MAKTVVAAGFVASVEEAFRTYLGEGAPAYVPKAKWGLDEAIGTVRRAGGLAVRADHCTCRRKGLYRPHAPDPVLVDRAVFVPAGGGLLLLARRGDASGQGGRGGGRGWQFGAGQWLIRGILM